MNLIGRWEKIRGIGAQGITPAMMLDRKWGQLQPFKPDWWCGENGNWFPIIAGGIGMGGWMNTQPHMFVGNFTTTISAGTTNLSSSYVAGTGGDAFGVIFAVPTAETITDIYYCIHSYTGTAANVNDIDIEIRTDSAGLPDTTGPGLVGSATSDPASVTEWVVKSGLNISLSAATKYHLIVGDADGNGTDYITTRRSFDTNSVPYMQINHSSEVTSTGWLTKTVLTAPTLLVFKAASGLVHGWSFSTSSSIASSTLQRGLYLSGFNERIQLFGVACGSVSNNYSGLNLWQGTTGPTGTPMVRTTYELRNGSTIAGFMFPSPVTLERSTPYRTVFTCSSNLASSHWDIGTGADATLRSAMLGGGSWYWTEESGGSWSDLISSYPVGWVLLVEDQVALQASYFDAPSQAQFHQKMWRQW